MTSRRIKQPPRLIEALGHIAVAGNLMPMSDVSLPQLDCLWNYIDGNGLAVMLPSGLWALTDRGRTFSPIVGGVAEERRPPAMPTSGSA